jgi:hypothetical protein
MAAVTASTKIDNPKMELAGVETGAKMFVGLIYGTAGSVAAALTADQRTNPQILTTAALFQSFVPLICV